MGERAAGHRIAVAILRTCRNNVRARRIAQRGIQMVLAATTSVLYGRESGVADCV
jgi:hypothetical protein